MRHQTRSLVSALAFIVAVACSYVADQDLDTGHAVIRNEAGDEVGRAFFQKAGEGVNVELTVSGLPTATYGVHVHGVGKCSGPAFASAGAPVLETGMEDPGESGSPTSRYLAKFEASGAREQTSTFTVAGLTFRPGPNSLFAPGGTALLLYQFSPDGTYGRPVACGVITRTDGTSVEAPLAPGHLESAESADKLGTGDDKTYRQPEQ